jgi:hypothetical protein
MLFANLNLLSQEENEAEKNKILKYAIAVSAVANAPERDFLDDKNFGFLLSFRYNPQSVRMSHTSWCLNAGFINLNNGISKNDYGITGGIHSNFKFVDMMYMIVTGEFGIIYKDSRKKISLFSSINAGLGYSITPNIKIEFISRNQYNKVDFYYSGFSVGLSYSFDN